MKHLLPAACLFAATAVAVALFTVGCETESATSQLISITPLSAELEEGQSVEFVASGASSYNWTLGSGSYGYLSASSGDRVLYTSTFSGGDSNTVTDTLTCVGAVDPSTSNGVYSAQATLVHIAEEDSDVTISPSSDIELEEGDSQTFTASGGDGEYAWTIDDDSNGFLSSSSGETTTFTSQYDSGTNGTEETVLLTVESGDDDFTVQITLQ